MNEEVLEKILIALENIDKRLAVLEMSNTTYAPWNPNPEVIFGPPPNTIFPDPILGREFTTGPVLGAGLPVTTCEIVENEDDPKYTLTNG